MIEQQGRVVEVHAQHAKVAFGAATGCSACDAGQGCGAGIFGKLVRRKDLTLVVDRNLPDEHRHLVPGQAVVVGIPETLFLGLLARLYLLPLLAGLCGAALGHYFGYRLSLSSSGQDLMALTGALFLATVTLLIYRKGKNPTAVDDRVQLLRCPDLQVGQGCRKP
jgi:positive regulator of sigma E activity